MKIRGHGGNPVYANIVRETRITANDPCFAAACDRAVKMHHLRPGVHACISAAGALHANGRSCNVRQRLLDSVLNGN